MDSPSQSAPQRAPALMTIAAVVVSVIFPVLSALAIFLRFKARRLSRQDLAADDWWMVAAWISGLSLCLLVWIFSSITGVEYYKIDTKDGITQSLKGLTIISFFDQFPLAFVKIAILLFYKRIFVKKWFAVVVWSLIFVVCSWGIVFSIGKPVSATWTGMGTFRVHSADLPVTQIITSIILDVIILCLPLPIVFRLHTTLRKKIVVASIFWMGAFCCVAPIVRFVYIEQTIKTLILTPAVVAIENKQIIWVFIEYNSSIIAGCLPTFGPLFAGGRAAESFIKSLKSMFSLDSIRRSSVTEEKTHIRVDTAIGVNSAPGSTGPLSPLQTTRMRTESEMEKGPYAAGPGAWKVQVTSTTESADRSLHSV